jgi:ribosomal protein L35
MRKSFTKRFKITKNKKIIRRKMAQNHFRSNKSGNQIRAKRKSLNMKTADIKGFLQLKNKGSIK